MIGSSRLGLAVLLSYLGVMAWHALSSFRRNSDVDDYHVAGRQLSGLVIGLSFYASFMSTNSFIGLVGKSWSWGLSSSLLVLCFVAFAAFSWRFIGPQLRRATERLQVVSLPEFLGVSFGSRGYRRLAAAVIIVSSIPYLQAVFLGGMLVMINLTGWSSGTALWTLWAVVVVYTVAGGFRAVAATDAIQAVIMIAAAVALPCALVLHAGGLTPLHLAAVHTLPQGDRGSFFWLGDVGKLLGVGLGLGCKMVAEPRQLSRFFALKEQQIRLGRWVAILSLGISYLLLLPVGFYARGVIDPAPANTDLIVPALLARADILPTLLGALFLAALLAAAMSSIDSVLLVTSAAIQRDLLGWQGSRSPLPELAMTRMWIVVFSIIPATLTIVRPEGIVGLTALSGAIYGAAFLPPLIHSLHGVRRVGSLPAWLSTLTGVGAVLLWKGAVLNRAPGIAFLHEAVVGIAISFLVFYLGAALSRTPHR